MELNEIKGIGVKRVQSLNETGIYTPSDLLLRFPDKYIDKNFKITNAVKDGDEVSFMGIVTTEATRKYVRRGLSIVTCSITNNDITIKCNWFNQPFAARSLKIGDAVYVLGKIKKFNRVIQITNPTLITPQKEDGNIIPVYKTAIPSRTFASAVSAALENTRVNSFVPTVLVDEFRLIPLQRALRSVHFPKDYFELETAKRSVAIENLAYVMSSYRLLKDDSRTFSYNASNDVIEEFKKSLPFALTGGQNEAIDAMLKVMRSERLMNMLVQGEVGCGKTVVALCAMYFAARSGYQSAFMCPTEVLARQHYDTMVKLLEPLGVKTQLLCASMNKTQRETAVFNIKYGAVSCVVGTQSLISDNIEYNNLRLVIVDEQQRFGVNQRAKLEEKGKKTDVIVMTATPIPRTLALSLYGELQQVEIRSVPKNRPTVHTSIVPSSKINDMYKYIAKKALIDERTYVICPRIESTDDNVNNVDDIYKKFKKSSISELTGCIHGKMKDVDKNAVMSDFKSGKIKVLVSTTVVEVGIDVPQATTVVVFDAERYGLSQLHQIRGRVGRGEKESYCFLISENGTLESDERLKNFCKMNDGFSVSEMDFRLRGAGDFVGLRQHGNGTLEIDERIIEQSRALSDAVVADGRLNESIIRSLKKPEFIRSVTMN